jgi:hypothetical protein
MNDQEVIMSPLLCARPRATGLSVLFLFLFASMASALPVELKDQNGTRYSINTDVNPLLLNSDASGAITDATYTKAVTVTSYFVGFTPFGFFLTTYTVQRQVNIPLTNAFAGFNGLLITGAHGVALPSAIVFNPGQPAASDGSCMQNGQSRQLLFATDPNPAFAALNLQVTRQVYVPDNSDFVRWLNIVTNTGSTAQEVGITLRGLLGAGPNTKIGATSSGDTTVTAGDLWFTSGQSVPQGSHSTEPTVGFVIQGDGAATPARSAGVNSLGQATVTYTPTIPPGGSVVIMTLTTVQGNFKQAKNEVTNLVALPSDTLTCMTEAQLTQVQNFAPIAPPRTKSATVTLKFNKTGQDTIQWQGKINIAAGLSLQGVPVTVDVGGATQTFILNKSGKAMNGGGNKFAVDVSLSHGVTKQGNVSFSFNMKGAFQSLFAPFGLTDATQKNVPVSLPLSFTVGSAQHYYGTVQAFTYKATQGKTGTAKNS